MKTLTESLRKPFKFQLPMCLSTIQVNSTSRQATSRSWATVELSRATTDAARSFFLLFDSLPILPNGFWMAPQHIC